MRPILQKIHSGKAYALQRHRLLRLEAVARRKPTYPVARWSICSNYLTLYDPVLRMLMEEGPAVVYFFRVRSKQRTET